jgi:DNA adenine methylase
MAFFRYPGGKTKMRRHIIPLIHSILDNSEVSGYSEIFFGGGGIGLQVLKEFQGLRRFCLNDFDVALASLWTAVIRYPDDFVRLIVDFKPSTEHFYSFKTELQKKMDWSEDKSDILQRGMMKLAIHQLSYSGLGVRSGGPLGGRNQTPESGTIASRWSPKHLVQSILQTHFLFNSVEIPAGRCTSADFSAVFDYDERTLIYLDPPYFVKGAELYQNAFAENDHIRLANLLKYTSHPWVLSYDDCPQIRDLYQGWATIRSVDIHYTVNGSHTKPELLITSPQSKRVFTLCRCRWHNQTAMYAEHL